MYYLRTTFTGNWRSWLARYTGSVEVTGSNPVFSTKKSPKRWCLGLFCYVGWGQFYKNNLLLSFDLILFQNFKCLFFKFKYIFSRFIRFQRIRKAIYDYWKVMYCVFIFNHIWILPGRFSTGLLLTILYFSYLELFEDYPSKFWIFHFYLIHFSCYKKKLHSFCFE